MRAHFISAAAASFAALLTVAGQAQAQATRTFVSGHGEDTNPCSLTAPCRSFAQAITQTAAGGEIAVLDTAGYGAVTINKPVSIINQDGVEAGVAVTSGNAITVNTGASDVVNLRGLTLTGGSVGNGIDFSNAGALNIQNCVIRGFGNGIAFEPVATAALNVSDTIVSNSGSTGILLFPSGSGAVTAAFSRVQAIEAPGAGFEIDGDISTGTTNVTIANSSATNSGEGIFAIANSGQTNVMVSNSVLSNSNTGVIESGTNSTTYLAKNTITGNGAAFSVDFGGVLFSFGDNYIKGNGDDGGTIPFAATK